MEKLKCSFCDKTDGQIPLFIQQKDVSICNECVVVCVQILSLQLRNQGRELRELVDLIHLQEQG